MPLKIGCLLQVAILAALGGLNTAIINPAYKPMAEELNISVVRASYQTTIVIALNGIAPFIWLPLANVYGRRPMYLFCTLLYVNRGGTMTSTVLMHSELVVDLSQLWAPPMQKRSPSSSSRGLSTASCP